MITAKNTPTQATIIAHNTIKNTIQSRILNISKSFNIPFFWKMQKKMKQGLRILFLIRRLD